MPLQHRAPKRRLAYTYDGHLMTSTTWSGLVSGAINWSYNNDFRPTSETVTTSSATSAIAFSHDDDGLKLRLAHELPETMATG